MISSVDIPGIEQNHTRPGKRLQKTMESTMLSMGKSTISIIYGSFFNSKLLNYQRAEGIERGCPFKCTMQSRLFVLVCVIMVYTPYI